MNSSKTDLITEIIDNKNLDVESKTFLLLDNFGIQDALIFLCVRCNYAPIDAEKFVYSLI